MCIIYQKYERCRGWKENACRGERSAGESNEKCWEVARKFKSFGACGNLQHLPKQTGTFQCERCETEEYEWKRRKAKQAWLNRWGLAPSNEDSDDEYYLSKHDFYQL